MGLFKTSHPSNVPIIGRMKYDNLYVNTGHGTLGWTLACGSSFCLSEIFEKRSPSLEFPFMYRLDKNDKVLKKVFLKKKIQLIKIMFLI